LGKSISDKMELESGEVILANVQYINALGIKKRPAVVLFQEIGNIIVAGVTSNLEMKGIPLSKEEGAIKDSVIKTNYIFTIGQELVEKKLFSLTKQKKNLVYNEIKEKISPLKN
jgi:mRNA interferase MazF